MRRGRPAEEAGRIGSRPCHNNVAAPAEGAERTFARANQHPLGWARAIVDLRLLKKRSFNHEGRSLEVRAAHSIHVWRLGIFEDGEPVSGEITRLSEMDVAIAREELGIDLIEQKMLQLQQEVEKGKLRLPDLHHGRSHGAS